MNLEDRLKAAAEAMVAPGDALEVRRRWREIERNFERVSAEMTELVVDVERHAALEHAYQAGLEAWRRGDMREAVRQLLVAADQRVGDAPALLAEALAVLGDYEAALRWCDVAAREGFADAGRLAARCRQLLDDPIRAKSRTLLRFAPTKMVPESTDTEDNEAARRRKFLAHAAAVTFGVTTFPLERAGVEPRWEHEHRRIGMTDVRQVEAATRALRSLDYQYGGWSCHDAVVAQLGWAGSMLESQMTGVVRGRLHVALADLNNLAGWVSFDIGRIGAARSYFSRAVDLLRDTGEHRLLAHVLWSAGRMYLHHREPAEALKCFQLSQVSAAQVGDPWITALVAGSEAWANVQLAKEGEALDLLKVMRAEIARMTGDERARVHAETISGLVGSVFAALGRVVDPKYATRAIPALNRALDAYGTEHARGRTFIFTSLSASHLLAKDVRAAEQTGVLAIDSADKVQSQRVKDEFVLLKQDADRHPAARLLAYRLGERLLRPAS